MAVMTHDQFVQQYGRAPAIAPGSNAQPQTQAPPKSLMDTISGGLDTVFGGNQIGESLVKAGTNLGNLVTGGVSKFNQGLPDNTVNVPQLAGDYVKAGSNFIPGAAKGAGLIGKTAIGAATGYAMDVGNNLKDNQPAPFTPGLGTAIAGALPIAGAVTRPATAIVGRLMKGIGSGLSGVSSKTIDAILNDPEAAQKATDFLKKNGNDSLLEKNARTIVDGVSQVRQEARSAYGNALGDLKAEDINPQTFRQSIQPVLDKFGVSADDKTRTLANVEFSDPKNLQKASNLIDELSTAKLDGLSLRNVMNKIEDAKFKTATSDERLSFNAFLNDLHSGVKDAVNGSTDKLSEINSKYSSDMQLAEATQQIFGKVKFKNLPEVARAARQLETLFEKKGIDPQTTDRFLTRIGVSPSKFKAGEAVRQISGKSDGANSVGLGMNEVAREATSAIINPQTVRDISIATGMAKEKITPFLQSLKTPARNAVIQALLQAQGNSQQPGTPGQ